MKPDVSSTEIFPPSFTVYRSDRNLDILSASRGGGVLVGVANHHVSELVTLPTLDGIVPLIDVICCKITINFFALFVFVLYVPPQVSCTELELFFDCLSLLEVLHGKNVLIFGDFNVPSFTNNVISDKKSFILRNFLAMSSLVQRNVVRNVNDRLLDLVMSNFECNVLRNYTPLVMEDEYHPSLSIDFTSSYVHVPDFQINRDPPKEYNFRKANFHLMYEMILGADWSYVYGSASVDEACDALYGALNNIFDSCVPVKIKRRSRYPTFYTRDIIVNIVKKEYARRSYIRFKSQFHLHKYINLRRLVKSQINAAYLEHIRDAERCIGVDPKNFWSFVRDRRGRSGIPGNVRDSDGHYSTAQDIVNAFGRFFHSVYTKSDPTIPNTGPLNQCWETFDLCHIEAADIITASKKLKNKLTSGPDSIPSFIVKDCIGVLADPLQHIFNLILSTSTFPSTWKVAKIVPVHKKDDSSVVNNYRPVSLLCNFSKLFEIIIHNRLYPFLRGLLSSDQHGFVDGRSCVTNLATFSELITAALDGRGQVDVVYTDFQKAFDRIDHYLLLHKLELFGLSGGLVSLFESYLCGRSQFVEHEGFRSPMFVSTSGVPQGSNLGPLLFNVFIDDIISAITCNKLAYADDLKLFLPITSLVDCMTLQNDINLLGDWCTRNRLYLNVAKCNTVSFHRLRAPVVFDYSIGDAPLVGLKQIRDLGVIFDYQLTFNPHVEHICTTSFQKLGFIIRNSKHFSEQSTLKLLYYTFIRSKLEYASLVWNPIYNCQVTSIESVQRRFLKYLSYRLDGMYPLRGLAHDQLLSRFNEPSLATRRKVVAAKFLYNLLNNGVDCVSLVNRIVLHVPRVEGRYQPTFHTQTARTNMLYRSPMHFMCSVYNGVSHLCDIFADPFSRIANTILGP